MLKIAARNLWRRKSRSVLAILALVVGILAIVLLISLTAGLQAMTTDLLSSVKGVMVTEKGSQDQTLSKIDASYGEKFESIPGVRAALPEVWSLIREIDGKRTAGVMGGSVSLNFVSVLGLDPVKEQRRIGNPYGVVLLRGRMMQPGDSGVAVLGKQIADDYKKGIGSRIEIDGKKFTVIGIFSKSTFTDMVIGMTIEDARGLAGLGSDVVQDFVVQPTNPENEERISTTIKFKWPDKFEVYSMAETSAMLGDMMGTIDQFFWVIAAIAMLIAGIGIINTMLIAVHERMGEFGVLRAMGWTRNDVLRLVITESVMLGAAGGAIGVALGYTISWLIAGYLPFAPVVTPQLALTAFLFSAAAGLAGGLYPAWKASEMDPIEAIRGTAL